MRLENRVAIVTGGANGIGRATTLRFAAEGARVAIWDKDEEAGRAVEEELRGLRSPSVQLGADTGTHHQDEDAPGDAVFQAVDVTDVRAVETAVADVLEAWGRIDILVNNAGILRDAQLVRVKDGSVLGRMSVEDFDSVIDVNLKAAFLCTRSVAPVMIRQNYGRILSTSSVVGLYGNFGQTNYVAAKAGIIGMTRVWARELGRYNITANAVAPGFIATDMTRSMPEKILEMMIERVPLRRIGHPEDVANTFLFLASSEAGYINGAVLSVDGGMITGT